MCHYKTISNNSFGCLIQCKNCEQFHLGFGSVVLILSYEDFIRFSDQVHHIHSMHYEEEDPSADGPKTEGSSDKDEKPKEKANKKIYMHTDNSKMVLAFNHKEWILLYQLLEESRFMLYANQLIDQA